MRNAIPQTQKNVRAKNATTPAHGQKGFPPTKHHTQTQTQTQIHTAVFSEQPAQNISPATKETTTAELPTPAAAMVCRTAPSHNFHGHSTPRSFKLYTVCDAAATCQALRQCVSRNGCSVRCAMKRSSQPCSQVSATTQAADTSLTDGKNRTGNTSAVAACGEQFHRLQA